MSKMTAEGPGEERDGAMGGIGWLRRAGFFCFVVVVELELPALD
jgi:hypothetical protein